MPSIKEQHSFFVCLNPSQFIKTYGTKKKKNQDSFHIETNRDHLSQSTSCLILSQESCTEYSNGYDFLNSIEIALK